MSDNSQVNSFLFQRLYKSFSNEVRKVVLPAWLGFYIVDLLFRPEFWLEWGVMRILVAIFLFFSANIIQHRWIKNNFDFAFAILAYPMNIVISIMIYMTREESLSPYLLGIYIVVFGYSLIMPITRKTLYYFLVLSFLPSFSIYWAMGNFIAAVMIFSTVVIIILMAQNSKYRAEDSVKAYLDFGVEINSLNEKVESIYKEKLELTKRNASAQTIAETSQFLAHDLKTPFSILRTITNRIKDGKIDSNKAREFVPILEKNNKYVEELLEDLLLAGGEFKISKKELPLSEFIQEAFDLCSQTKGLSKALDNQIPSDIFIHADPKYLQRVFTNLFFNAFSVTKEKPEASYWAKAAQRDNHLRIEIGNSDSYLTPKQCDEIFIRFHSESKEEGRSGLGLSIVSEIVRRHSGSISCHSSQGNGTHFVITLPAKG